ncbi:intracellular septation protein A [Erythrobacter arachoides]|uniref:Inner membrane-spanning protein YciB n=1 Tax=Aurantiacibacter arachoides TaxID=1850444 RepID=A0A845A1U3_9SPHN|nr:inner membrane-spanning protein YciB [Aurantiacibacter arachoides]MXO92927.1 intracellular septation protein A [Aurantiacibacter arachoides]GGD53353.1 putative intracellular septation protein A [Aurantiacibacter arachoides]
MTSQTKPKGNGWLNVAVDYGPLVVFYLAYKYFSPENDNDMAGEIFAVIRGTLAFIVAAVIALAVSKWRLGKVSPMLMLSTALIVGFGALTVYFQDERFIEWKPSIVYALFAAVLLIGYARGKSLLKVLLEAAFDGLSDEGWLKLSRNWGLFFIALAALNTVLIYTVSFETWLGMKLWLFLPLTFLFTFSQVPMLMRHGLDVGDTEEAAEKALKNEPPTG